MDGDLMIDVAGLRMFGRPGRGPYVVVKDGMEGWEEGVDMRSENTPVSGGHGSYSVPRYQESRTVTIRGVILADSARELTNYSTRLRGLLAHGRPGRVQVQSGGLTLWADGQLASKTKITKRRGTHYADFTLNLWFPDPRQFGDMNTFTLNSGTATGVFHRGNYWATPKYTIRGSMPGGYTLHLAGTYYTVGRALVSTAPHTIDFRNGRLYVGGVLTSGGIAAAANLTLVGPGGVPTAGIEPTTTGTAVATMELLDTYV